MATADLDDCNYMHYTLQLSLYRYILEFHYNLNIKNHAIVHLTPDGVSVHECDYLKSHIVDILNVRRAECLL